MRVLLVTTWDTPCGIAEHAAMLKEAVEAADPEISIIPFPRGLDPAQVYAADFVPHVLHLNYQAALHSAWSDHWIQRWRTHGTKVLVTYHDTGVPNSEQCKRIVAAADAAVVHEHCEDLPEKARYWRMGVPEWERPFAHHTEDRPLLGTIGFPFGWKNYDALCQVATTAGWEVLLLAPGASDEQIAQWTRYQLPVTVVADFLPRKRAISLLAGCDATAFTYVTHNTGQSGAILLGIAAHKPVIALFTCRQFRSLYFDKLGHHAIRWCDTFEDVGEALTKVPIARCDPGIVALAEQESWRHLGAKYAQLYRELGG